MISQKEYAKRRTKFAKKMKNNSIALFLAAKQKIRSNDTEYRYRQNSNFYYLSGFKEDESALLFVKKNKKVTVTLFVAKKDPQKELWHGKRLGCEAAKERFLVDSVACFDALNERVREVAVSSRFCYYDFSRELPTVLMPYISKFEALYNGAKRVEKMRLIKSDAEIALIKRAIAITKEAHHRAMKKAPLSAFEYELEAEIEYVFAKNGAQSNAYTSIVAAGESANTLHYIENDKALKKGELVLVDAGCEYGMYSSDITRCFVTSGTFSKEQRAIYELVLSVEKKIIKSVKAGVLRSKLQKKAQKLLLRGLVSLGVIDAKMKKRKQKELLKELYPHGIGHWMGLDVHDEAPYVNKKGKEIALREGMVLTIEPGLYLSEANKKIPKRYRGIGVRIEDDILVTKEGCENLSAGIAKEIAEVEALAASVC